MSAPYPWLADTWRRLQQARAADTLPHALLLHGRPGFGKRELAQALVASLLCDKPDVEGTGCGQCRGCSLLTAGSHPDYRAVQPEEPGKSIVIDQIRELGEFFTLRPHYGARKLAVIAPADAMNRAAANSLLKLLEEPPAGGMLLLVADRQERLPATIRSRCQGYVLDRFDPTSVLRDPHGLAAPVSAESLARAGGSPLAAGRFEVPELRTLVDSLPAMMAAVASGAASPLEAAGRLGKLDLVFLLDQMLRISHELLLLKVGATLPLAEAGRAVGRDLQRMADGIDSPRLAQFVQQALELKQLRLGATSAREGDLIESLWFEWQRVGPLAARQGED